MYESVDLVAILFDVETGYFVLRPGIEIMIFFKDQFMHPAVTKIIEV